MKLISVSTMVLLSAIQFACVQQENGSADKEPALDDAKVAEERAIASSNNEQIVSELTIEAQQKIAVFSSTLKQALVGAIKSGGLIHAVDVCQSQAPAIAQSVSVDGWQVGRTSLQTRNSKNVADEWETSVLSQFNDDYKSGEKAAQLSAFIQNDEQFRYMQAIETQQVCLACHGPNVDANLLDAINQRYSNDMATGFTLKDLRGAFTLSKAL